MKNIIRVIIVVACFLFGFCVDSFAGQTQDKQLVKEYCNKQYKGYKVRIKPAEQTPDSVIENRKGKKVVYVDVFKTISRGKYGIVTKGVFKGKKFKYARKHKYNKTVLLYLIYNPYSNYIEDIPAFVEAGRLVINE